MAEQKNLYEKIQQIKSDLLRANLKKSGFNNFSNYSYYELSDILPAIVELCNQHKVYTYVSFSEELASLTAVNMENTAETLCITSPMRSLELKGCNQIQSLGGVETYSRRYLYMAMFDIVENDMFDGTTGRDKDKTLPPPSKPAFVCDICKKPFRDKTIAGNLVTAEQQYITLKARSSDGVVRCEACREKAKQIPSRIEAGDSNGNVAYNG